MKNISDFQHFFSILKKANVYKYFLVSTKGIRGPYLGFRSSRSGDLASEWYLDFIYRLTNLMGCGDSNVIFICGPILRIF